MNSRFLNISYFNINSITNKKIELENYLVDNNIDVQLLSETFLKDNSKIKK